MCHVMFKIMPVKKFISFYSLTRSYLRFRFFVLCWIFTLSVISLNANVEIIYSRLIVFSIKSKEGSVRYQRCAAFHTEQRGWLVSAQRKLQYRANGFGLLCLVPTALGKI